LLNRMKCAQNAAFYKDEQNLKAKQFISNYDTSGS